LDLIFDKFLEMIFTSNGFPFD